MKKVILILLGAMVTCFTGRAQATPVLDATGSSCTSGSITSLTLPFTCTGTNSNGILVVYMSYSNGVGNNPSVVTYGGVSLTLGQISTAFNNEQAWYLLNPATGTANVQLNWGGNVNPCVGIASFTGVVGVSASAATNTGASANLFSNFTTTAPSSLILSFLAANKYAASPFTVSGSLLLTATSVSGNTMTAEEWDAQEAAAGVYPLAVTASVSGGMWQGSLEVLAYNSPTSTITPTTTPTSTVTPTSTATPTASPSFTMTYVNTATPNPTQTPHTVTFDNASILTMTAGSNGWIMPYTVGTGPSTALLVHVFMPLGSQTDYTKSVTYGGIPMVSMVANRIGTVSGHPYSLKTYYLLVPPTGSNNIVVTQSVTEASETVVSAESWFNVWYVANMSAINAPMINALSQTYFTGAANGTLTGCFAAFDSAGITTINISPFVTNRAIYSVGGSENVYMSLDDVRNYNPNSVPIFWKVYGANPDPLMMQYTELVPR
jgi:hypothetical protein